MFGILRHSLLEGTFQLVGILQQIFDRAIFLEKFLRRLLSDTRAAGNVIGTVTHQTQEVDHLVDRSQRVFIQDFFDAHHLVVASELGAVHKYMFGYQLAVVFVGCHHINFESLFLGLLRYGADHIVCLKAGDFQYRDIVCFYNILYNRNGLPDHFRGFFPLCLV